MKYFFVFFLFVAMCSCQNKQLAQQSKGLPLASQWIIAAFYEDGEAVYSESKSSYITIHSDLQTFDGNGACNRISGKMEADTEKHSIRFFDIVSTKMACPHIAQETKFINMLHSATSYQIDGGEMTLYKGKQKLLQLESYR
jgi:heat shock protein HslJ